MITEHNKHSRSHIDLHVRSALADCEYDHTMTITLPMWRWMAVSALAEFRDITSTDLVTRWIRRACRPPGEPHRAHRPGVTPLPRSGNYRELLALAGRAG